MDVYMLSILLMLVGGIYADVFHERKQAYIKIYLIGVCFIWIIIATFRDATIGTDTVHYLNAFYGTTNEHFEVGYRILN